MTSTIATLSGLSQLASLVAGGPASVCDFDTPYACNAAQRAALQPVSQDAYGGFGTGPAVTCVVGSQCGAMPLGACQAAGGTPVACCPGSGCNKPGTPGFASDPCTAVPMSTQASLLSFSESAKLAKRSQSSVMADLVGVSVPAQFAPGAIPARFAPGAFPAQFAPGAFPAQFAPGAVPAQLVTEPASAQLVLPGRPSGGGGSGMAGMFSAINRAVGSPSVFSPIVVSGNTGPVRITSNGQVRTGCGSGACGSTDAGFSSASASLDPSADGGATSAALVPPSPSLVCPPGFHKGYDGSCVRNTPAPNPGACPAGHFQVPDGTCVPIPGWCPPGFHFENMTCVANTPAPNPTPGPYVPGLCGAGTHYDAASRSCVRNAPAPNPMAGSASGHLVPFKPVILKSVKAANRTGAKLSLGSVVAAEASGTAVLPRGKKLAHGGTSGLLLSAPRLPVSNMHVTLDGVDGAGGVAYASYYVPVASMAVGVPQYVHPVAQGGDVLLGPLVAKRAGKLGDSLELTAQ